MAGAVESVRAKLMELSDEGNRAFVIKLIPTLEPERVIGARAPGLRALAKELAGTPEAEAFLKSLPHEYHEENILHGCLIERIKDYDACLAAVEAFLPYVDNWAVCDLMSPKVFKKHLPELWERIKLWCASGETYTVRFGMEMLMSFYLDDAFSPEQPELVASVESGEYYVRMMQAWYFATALAKQWEGAVPYIEGGALEKWTHNKTIQKAVESYRITPEQKAYLKTLKLK